MARMVLVFIAALYCVSSIDAKAITVAHGVVGWYWWDLLHPGQIPDNALPAGKDNQGEITYIGQTPHFAGETVVPGAYVPHSKKMFYEFGKKQWSTDINVKVLCTQEPGHFKWVKAQKGNAVTTTEGWELVPGGTEFKKVIGIGRVHIENEIVLGKVNFEGDNYELLHYNRNDQGLTSSEFEVLYFVKDSKQCSDEGIVITIN